MSYRVGYGSGPARRQALKPLMQLRRDVAPYLGLENDAAPSSEDELSPVSTARPLSVWLEDPELLRRPVILIPHLAVEGRVSLLSGREKIGKSTLAAGAVADASRGDAVLGMPLLDSVRTLWYALDEHVSDAVRRFQMLGANVERIAINDRPRSQSDLLTALEIDFQRFPVLDLVVLDNLSRVLAFSGIDPNSSREVEPVIAKLVDFFHRQNKAALFLYHTGKGGREYRGSTAIGATVDEVLTLRKRGQSDEDDFVEDDSDDGRRLLVQDGRNLRGRVQITFKDGVYRPYEETAEPREKILEALRDHGSVNGRAELTKLAGVRKQTGLKVIGELIGSGAIIESGRYLRVGSAGSAQFLEGGTTEEPRREPGSDSGSHSGRVGVTETGTGPETRVLDRSGKQMVQELRLTQHGDRWIDQGLR
jgi:hypothetical protein